MTRVLLIGRDDEFVGPMKKELQGRECDHFFAAGDADALRRLRQSSYDVVITNPLTSIDEDLALIEEMREVRPGVKAIILAPHSTPEEVIAALRARVFACFCAPFDVSEIADFAVKSVSDADWRLDIEVRAAQPNWVSLRANCRLMTAERVLTFLKELRPELPPETRDDLVMAFREILVNAMEHGGQFKPAKVVEIAAVRTERAIVFYVHDPGVGFQRDSLPQSAMHNPADSPNEHLKYREEHGLRPGGYGILLARGVVDELMYSEVGNEVILIKHMDHNSRD